MIASIVACCTANDGDGGVTTSASAPAATWVDDGLVGCLGVRKSVSSWTEKKFDRCRHRGNNLLGVIYGKIPLFVQVLLFNKWQDSYEPRFRRYGVYVFASR